MFIKNKYQKWYFNIINNTKKLKRSKKDQYLEEHHIIPDSFTNSNYSKNLVLLTPREHFICHLLLTKFTTGIYRIKALSAFNMLKANTKDRYQNFESFIKTRQDFLNSLKDVGHQHGSKNSNFQMKWIKFDFLAIQMKLPRKETFKIPDKRLLADIIFIPPFNQHHQLRGRERCNAALPLRHPHQPI